MNEVKFPVIARIDGKTSFKWLTLAQTNERFIVVNGHLVANKVEPLVLNYCQFLLEQSQKSLAASQENFELLCEDVASCKNERFISGWLMPKLNKCKAEIKNAEHDISFLKQAIVFLKSE